MTGQSLYCHARVSDVLACVAFLSAFLGAPHAEEPTLSRVHAQSQNASETKQRVQSKSPLRQLHLRARAVTVYQIGKDKKTLGKLVPEPVFRYTDQPAKIVDATLWCWHVQGRPIALQKVEYYRRPNYWWFYCMASLSESRIEVEWREGQRWSSKKPGISFQELPGGPVPAGKKVRRLLQMKNIARRFSTEIYYGANNKEQMRLMPRPIYRYDHPNSEVRDGAIFGFGANGTNPNTLLLIELHQPDRSAPSWKYGLAQMTTGKLSVRLDEKEVWTAPYRQWRPVSKFDTFMFFRASPATPNR